MQASPNQAGELPPATINEVLSQLGFVEIDARGCMSWRVRDPGKEVRWPSAADLLGRMAEAQAELESLCIASLVPVGRIAA